MTENILKHTIACLVFLFIGLHTVSGFCMNPVKVIFDTDISSDVDDVGAVAVLHALADQGKAEILGMMVSSGDPWSAPCLDALNTWFGRPDIPIGMIKKPTVIHESKYTKLIALNYPNDLQRAENAPDAATLYRQVLSDQPDGSVTIVTVGYLTNLKKLLDSRPDAVSSLTGLELVKNKVKKLVCMGGDYIQGREWNFYQDARSTQDVVHNWPTRVDFIGYSLGLEVLTGQPLREDSGSSPVRLAYKHYDQFAGRPSWDQIAVLYAGLDRSSRAAMFNTSTSGVNSVSENGSNYWQRNEAGNHYYVRLIHDSKELVDTINKMMQSR